MVNPLGDFIRDLKPGLPSGVWQDSRGEFCTANWPDMGLEPIKMGKPYFRYRPEGCPVCVGDAANVWLPDAEGGVQFVLCASGCDDDKIEKALALEEAE